MQSLKKEIINSLLMLPTFKGFEDNLLVVVTAAGIITGKPVIQDDMDSDAKIFNEALNDIAVNYKTSNAIPIETPIDGDDGAFVLKHAILKNGNTNYELSTITIFFDQVIAFSIGKIS